MQTDSRESLSDCIHYIVLMLMWALCPLNLIVEDLAKHSRQMLGSVLRFSSDSRSFQQVELDPDDGVRFVVIDNAFNFCAREGQLLFLNLL